MSSLTAITSSILVFILPFGISAILSYNFKRLDIDSFKQRFNALYDGTKTQSRYAVQYYAVFVLRRLVFAVCVNQLEDYPNAQVSLLTA